MPVCTTCQTDLPGNAKFCPNCGSAIEQDQENLYSTASRRVVSPLEGPSGIGGWMILVVLGLFVITGTALAEMISSLNYLDLISFIIYLILFAYGVVCIVFMFKKSRLFPKFYIGLLCSNFGISVLVILWLYIMDVDVSDVWSDLGSSFGGALIWTTYMLTSKRVKNTFIR